MSPCKHLASKNTDTTQATSFIEDDNDGSHIAEAVQKGTSIVVSNSSLKDNFCSTACIIEDEEHNIHQIVGTATPHRDPLLQDS
eukprot:6846902-Ditylum_brightwellii.AAC.1